jgi:sugar/nucleoside kinase (ribokinase family)
MKFDVSAIGPLNIDLLIRGEGPSDWNAIPTWDGPAHMEMTAAGSVGYTVTHLGWLGLSVRVSSCLSNDPLGVFIQSALRRAGVNVSGIQVIPDTVGGIGVYMLLFGSRKRPLVYRLPSHPLWPTHYSAAEVDILLNTRLLHNGGYLHHDAAWHGDLVEIYREARQRGIITTMDCQFPVWAMPSPWLPALDDILPYIDLFFCDETEARGLTAETHLDSAARHLLNAGAHTVIIKQGIDGSTLYRQGWQHHQSAVVIGDLVDSIGAGDVFDAAFIYGTLQSWPLEQCALFASIAAGFSVTGIGGSQPLPDMATLLAEVQKRQKDTRS